MNKKTPMMQQWEACKERAGNAVLLFRMGDFYEAFHQDAELIARELEITLTKRQEVPMAGVPSHACEAYLDRLLAKGHRVAVAEQTQDPKATGKLVRREVVRILTPGTAVDSSLISETECHYILALSQVGHITGLAILELSTGDFRVTEFEDPSALAVELSRLGPKEVLISERCEGKHATLLADLGLTRTVRPEWWFDHKTACQTLCKQLEVGTLDGFGLRGMVAAINAAGGLLSYLTDELALNLSHLQTVLPYSTSDTVALDPVTQRNLLLTAEGRQCPHTLLNVLDQTSTPMGGRLMREWVKRPLRSVEAITRRQEHVAFLYADANLSDALSHALRDIRDLERLAMKVSAGWATPRDVATLGQSLCKLPELQRVITASRLPPLDHIHSDLAQTILMTLSQAPPVKVADGGVIRAGVSKELDELRALQSDSKAWMVRYQAQIREETGIKTLKVGYNRVFGYYLEVSKGQADKMPQSFTRRQTLVNAERFISPKLKEYETKVLGATDRIAAVEAELFSSLRTAIAAHTHALLTTGRTVAELDALCSLGQVARRRGYVRPIVDDSRLLHIQEGRHPVVEATQGSGPFIANDTDLDGTECSLALLTGPNMAGKSTYIRQVALIVLMAQMGSFVPANAAHIGAVDQVFTRIGASDDLARGQSTFMVEMAETANILHNATDRSLVILDEIGRGTSTYDGVSIAWSVAEYLLMQVRARTLFATHYFELTQLEQKLPGARNFNVAVQEEEGRVVFLHRIVPGGADRSYGIHVARLAGLPPSVVARAQTVLAHLEQGSSVAKSGSRMLAHGQKPIQQLTLFS